MRRPDWNIEDLTDVEIYAAIAYLEPESQCPNEGNNDYGVVICVCLDIALIACLAFSGSTKDNKRFRYISQMHLPF